MQVWNLPRPRLSQPFYNWRLLPSALPFRDLPFGFQQERFPLHLDHFLLLFIPYLSPRLIFSDAYL